MGGQLVKRKLAAVQTSFQKFIQLMFGKKKP
jgi:hypothetical protein